MVRDSNLDGGGVACAEAERVVAHGAEAGPEVQHALAAHELDWEERRALSHQGRARHLAQG